MNQFPFDDRIHPFADIAAISEKTVREFIEDTGVVIPDGADLRGILEHLDVLREVDGQPMLTHLALLFFAAEPERWVRGARIEVVHFDDREGTSVADEKIFTGPLHMQVEEAARHVASQSTSANESENTENGGDARTPIPDGAIEELLVNAVCHRGWGESTEGIKVYVFPDRYEVISYPGPHPALHPDHFAPGRRVPPVPLRNRRIVEYMKLLGFADGAYCGLPMIYRMTRESGAPHPHVDFDEQRSWFRVVLPTRFERTRSSLRDLGFARAGGRQNKRMPRGTFRDDRGPAVGIVGPIGVNGPSEAHSNAAPSGPPQPPLPVEDVPSALSNAEFMIDEGRLRDALDILDRMPEEGVADADQIRAAILERRVRRHDRAHALFERVLEVVSTDPRTLHEFAQTKINLAQEIWRERGLGRDVDDNRRVTLLEEARDIIQKVVRMDAPPTRHAWAWFNLGQILYRLRAPRGEVTQAYETAVRLAPREERFREALEKHRQFDN